MAGVSSSRGPEQVPTRAEAAPAVTANSPLTAQHSV